MNTYNFWIYQTQGGDPPKLKGYAGTWRSPIYANEEETDPGLLAQQAEADAEAQSLADKAAADFAAATGLSNIIGTAVKNG